MRHRAWRILSAALIASACGLTAAWPAAAAPSRAGFPRLTWSTPAQVATQPVFHGALSCPTAQFCVIVDESGHVHVFDGRHWRRPVFLGFSAADTWAVSCPTAKWCAASDTYGHVSYYHDGSWSALQQVGPPAQMSVLSCASYRFCAALGYAGFDASTYNGRTWSRPVPIDPGTNGMDALACPAQSLCMAVDGSGNAIQYNGRTWLKPRRIDGSAYLDAIACPTVKFCVAVDNRGEIVTWNGRTWARPERVDGSAYLAAVACAGTTFCLAADDQQNVIQVIGRRYLQHIRHFYFDVALSCASSSFCAAVNDGGQVIIGTVPARSRR